MRAWIVHVGLITALIGSGCAVNFVRRSPQDIQRLAELSAELDQFRELARLKAGEADEFRRAKSLMEGQFDDSEASIGYDERGLVTRLIDQVLFDSGKAELRGTARSVLDRVAHVLKEVPDQPVAVEGHTDNVPIMHSGWASNQALSEARAKAVTEHLAGRGLDASRLIARGYGDSKPIASNDDTAGRQQNRRVEIVILPQSSRYGTESRRHSTGTAYQKK
ncbi:MAG TPA: OmpA family protein [bacterium]